MEEIEESELVVGAVGETVLEGIEHPGQAQGSQDVASRVRLSVTVEK